MRCSVFLAGMCSDFLLLLVRFSWSSHMASVQHSWPHLWTSHYVNVAVLITLFFNFFNSVQLLLNVQFYVISQSSCGKMGRYKNPFMLWYFSPVLVLFLSSPRMLAVIFSIIYCYYLKLFFFPITEILLIFLLSQGQFLPHNMSYFCTDLGWEMERNVW